MNIKECFKSALKNTFSNKMRTFLTMLGIIIGISSVILIVSIGNGSQSQIEEEFESISTGALTISLSTSDDIESRDILYMEDYDLLKSIEGVSYVLPEYNGKSTDIKLLDPKETKSANVSGVTSDAYYINKPNLLYGKYISERDVDMETKVAVIQDTTALNVFGRCDESVIGEKISLKTWKGTTKFTVIGITENKNAESQMQYSSEYPEEIEIPISTAINLYNTDFILSFKVLLDDLGNTEQMKYVITNTLENAHGNKDKYVISDTSAVVDSINEILSYVTLFISFVAGISLFVGGIGVMNIMMVTVTERTREIGIRKSIGAKNKDIRTQFLTEAVILTGIGGVAGLILGYFGALIVGGIIGIPPLMKWNVVLIAVSISVGIGIIFGVTPANKAAKLNPIEALRYE